MAQLNARITPNNKSVEHQSPTTEKKIYAQNQSNQGYHTYDTRNNVQPVKPQRANHHNQQLQQQQQQQQHHNQQQQQHHNQQQQQHNSMNVICSRNARSPLCRVKGESKWITPTVSGSTFTLYWECAQAPALVMLRLTHSKSELFLVFTKVTQRKKGRSGDIKE